MNRLDADLKRLMRWSRGAERPGRQAEEMPFGFAARVVASRNPGKNSSLLSELRQFALASGCVALVVILFGLVILVRQPQVPEPAAGIPPALSFLASNLTP